jgi:ABC-type phosphate transport system substrate-binding protein
MRVHAFLIALLLTLLLTGTAVAERLAIIVNVDRVVELDLEAIAQIYLKHRRFWAGGDPIVPVNREAGSPSRERFTRRVLHSDAAKLGIYWNRQYFQGVLPPATLASDQAILRFVARDRRAIGYVNASVVDSSVRVVMYVD